MMKVMGSSLCLWLFLAGCAPQPDWKSMGVLRASQITQPATYENPFIIRAGELDSLAARLSSDEREQVRAKAKQLADAATDYRNRLSGAWTSFITLRKEGERVFRCELLEDQYFVIEDRGQILAEIWVGPTNHQDRIGKITFPTR